MVCIVVIYVPLKELGFIPGKMVPGMPGKPEEPDPNPHSCDIDYSQRQEWDHQGWLGHFQQDQQGEDQVQRAPEGCPEVFPQLQCCGPSSDEIN